VRSSFVTTLSYSSRSSPDKFRRKRHSSTNSRDGAANAIPVATTVRKASRPALGVALSKLRVAIRPMLRFGNRAFGSIELTLKTRSPSASCSRTPAAYASMPPARRVGLGESSNDRLGRWFWIGSEAASNSHPFRREVALKACVRVKCRLEIATLIVVVAFASGATHGPAPASEPRQRQEIVYVTKTGTKYHRDGCQYLRQSKIPMALSEAVRWYAPCSRCRPPTSSNRQYRQVK
jgi:hypothetical protein